MDLTTILLLSLVTFILGFTGGILAMYVHESSRVDWLIHEYEKQLDVAKHTITRLDAIVSERLRRSNETKFSPIHCQPLPTNDIEWEELDFPNKETRYDR